MTDQKESLILGECIIHPSSKIHKGVIIGKVFRKFLDGTQEEYERTIIEEETYIGYYSVIGTGSKIAMGAIIDDHCIIESRVIVGKKSLITHRAQICNDVTIGEECVIGGFIGERTRIGNNCRIFGKIVHLQHNPKLGWDDDEAIEGAPNISDGVFIGFNAIVAGNVAIGRKAYICAGSIVTRDIPELHVVSGNNTITHFTKWKGRLRHSSFFKDTPDE